MRANSRTDEASCRCAPPCPSGQLLALATQPQMVPAELLEVSFTANCAAGISMCRSHFCTEA